MNCDEPVIDGYGGEGASILVDCAQTLPFTGMDVTLMILGALLLVAVGLILRGVTRDE